jgi:hypothetical protein
MSQPGPDSESRDAMTRAFRFLREAQCCPASDREWYEACLEASLIFGRAAVHRTKERLSRQGHGSTWWESIAGDPSVEFVRNHRDHLLKEASAKVGQIVFVGTATDDGPNIPPDAPELADGYYFFEDASIRATTTAEKHLTRVRELISNAEAGD